MRGILFSLLVLGVATAVPLNAAAKTDTPSRPVTFTRDVLPILQDNCQTCHRPEGDNYTGMVAPMSFMTYEEVRPWAKSIARQVESGKMPPWFADAAFHGVFANERSLSADEIGTLVRWAKTGARRGDPADAPEPRVFAETGGWRIGHPDLVVTAPRYFVDDDEETHYTSHVVELTEEMLPESRWIKAIEWKGGSSVVHHIVGYAYMPGQPQERGRGYGLGSIAPGEEPMHFPDGYAKLLVKGSTVVFSMHYHKEPGPGTGVWDESQVAFKFYPRDAEIRYFVEHNAIGNRFFDIPPGHPNWRVGAAREFDEATTLISMHPHMHVRGKDARYVAFLPDGTTETLLYVPAWDFNWQSDYSFKVPKSLPAGTRVEFVAHYDNSPENEANPDPTAAIDWGRETWDEMMLGYVTYAASEPRELTIEGVLAEYFTPREGGPSEE